MRKRTGKKGNGQKRTCHCVGRLDSLALIRPVTILDDPIYDYHHMLHAWKKQLRRPMLESVDGDVMTNSLRLPRSDFRSQFVVVSFRTRDLVVDLDVMFVFLQHKFLEISVGLLSVHPFLTCC